MTMADQRPRGFPSGRAASDLITSAAKLQLKTVQLVNDNGNPVISWQSNSAIWDLDGWFDFAGQPTRLTCPKGKGGKYIVTGAIAYAANANGFRGLDVNLNFASGANKDYHSIRNYHSGTGAGCAQFTSAFDIAETDYLEFYAYIGSVGANLNALADPRTFLAVLRNSS